MKHLKFYLIPILILSINGDIININIGNSISTQTDYSVSENSVTLTTEGGEYELTGIGAYNFIVSKSCTINLNNLSLGAPTTAAILIKENCDVSLVLKGTNNLADTTNNENAGVIYLNEGAKLTISGDGILNIEPNKKMAINGTVSTSLIVNGGAINIKNTKSINVGGIYLREGITFKNGEYNFDIKITTSDEEKPCHAIDSEGSIYFEIGNYNIISGEGKGIQTEKNLFVGVEGGKDDDLEIR